MSSLSWFFSCLTGLASSVPFAAFSHFLSKPHTLASVYRPLLFSVSISNSQWGWFSAPQDTSGNDQRHFWLSRPWWVRMLLLATSRQRPGILLNILHCTERPPPQRLTQTKMSVISVKVKKSWFKSSTLFLSVCLHGNTLKHKWIHCSTKDGPYSQE